jgi:hypothetical protein
MGVVMVGNERVGLPAETLVRPEIVRLNGMDETYVIPARGGKAGMDPYLSE